MHSQDAAKLFESLSSPIRLDIVRLLTRYGTTGCVAGQIATELDIPPTNLSFHLKSLTQSALIAVEQEGRFLRYRANLDLMKQLTDYLTAQCCADFPSETPCCPLSPEKT